MDDIRGALMAEQEHAARLAAVKAEYEQEIEKLRQELAVEKGWVQQYRDSYGKCAADISKQQAEIERLSTTLINLAKFVVAQVEHNEDAKFYDIECLHCTAVKILTETLSND